MMQHYMKKGNTRYSPEQGQEWEIMIFAREVGAAEAKIAILKMELTGSEREGNRELIRKLLRMRYQSEKAKTKSEPAGADQPATKPADKAPVKD